MGRFTTPVEPVPLQHNRWAVQQVLFEEVPGATMLHYPGRWDTDAIWRYPFSDFGELQVACSPTADWTINSSDGALTGKDLVGANTLGDTAALSYLGYGFQFWAPTSHNSGISQLYLDGVLVATLDQYSAGAVKSFLQHEELNVPLGKHTVQLVATHTKNVASAGYLMVWDSLKVMR